MSVRSLRIALRSVRFPSVCCKARLPLVSLSRTKRKEVTECIGAIQSLSSRLLSFPQQLVPLHKAWEKSRTGPSFNLAACAAFAQSLRVHCLVVLHDIRTSWPLRFCWGFWTWASVIASLDYPRSTRLHEAIHVTKGVRGHVRVITYIIGAEECRKLSELGAHPERIQIVSRYTMLGIITITRFPAVSLFANLATFPKNLTFRWKLTLIRAKGVRVAAYLYTLHTCTPAHACVRRRMSRSIQESTPRMQHGCGSHWHMLILVGGCYSLVSLNGIPHAYGTIKAQQPSNYATSTAHCA